MKSSIIKYNTDKRMAIWAERIRDCRDSGLNVSQWCRNNNVSSGTFYKWQKKLFALAQTNTSHTACEQSSSGVSGIVDISTVVLGSDEPTRPVATIRACNTCVDIFPGATTEIVEAIVRGISHA